MRLIQIDTKLAFSLFPVTDWARSMAASRSVLVPRGRSYFSGGLF